MPAGGVAGIVIAVLFVVFAVCFYFYRTQRMNYIRRFIKIPAFSLYSFLPDDSKYSLKKKKKSNEKNRQKSEDLNSDTMNPILSMVADGDGDYENESHGPSGDTSVAVAENVVDVAMTNVVKSGYLMKKAVSLNRGWLKRWFFIKDGQLFYTHKHTALTKDKHIYAVLVANLVISTVRTTSSGSSSPSSSDTSKMGKEFQIVSPGQRGLGQGGGVYELMADTEEEAASWVHIIRQQIEGSLTKTLEANMHDPSDATATGQTDVASVPVSSSVLLVPSEKVIRELKALNPLCVDCGAANPEWASLNLCIMMCIDCSGVHRNMGSHVSKVRSIKLDKWTTISVELMQNVGNVKSNSLIWESRIGHRPLLSSSSRDMREKFIRDKYIKRLYMEPQVDVSNRVEAALFLLSAAEKGDVLKLLGGIAAGVNVNAIVEEAEIRELQKQYQSSSGGHKRDGSILLNFAHANKTALAVCCKAGNALCVELLLQNNASIDAIDSDGLTPLDIAMIERHSQIIEILTSVQKRV